MFKNICSMAILAFIGFKSSHANAHPHSRLMNNNNNVGLGLGAGLQVPTAENPFKPSEAWGFYTDIPLLETFHVSPSTLVYRLTPKDGGANQLQTSQWILSLSYRLKSLISWLGSQRD